MSVQIITFNNSAKSDRIEKRTKQKNINKLILCLFSFISPSDFVVLIRHVAPAANSE